MQGSQDHVFSLAQKITEILNAHPNPYEAEAACGMAKEASSCRVRQWPFSCAGEYSREQIKPLPDTTLVGH